MAGKEFTLTLHGSSICLPSWLYPVFSEFLHPEMQARYEPIDSVEGDVGVAIQFKVNEAVEIDRRVKTSGLRVSHHRDDKLYLYLPKCGKARFHSFRGKKVSAEIKCSFENGWLSFYYLPEWRRRDLNAAFG